MADLTDIITSRVRVKLIELFLSDITELYHVRGITRKAGEEINAVRRELERLHQCGFLSSEMRGNRLYYWVRKEYDFFGDLLSIVAKSTGIGKEIIENKKKVGKLAYVMFSGKFTRRKKRKKDDEVDILIVGNDVILPELAAVIRKEESIRGHEINYTVMSRDEFIFRKKRRDPFLLGILSESRVMIIGDEEDLIG